MTTHDGHQALKSTSERKEKNENAKELAKRLVIGSVKYDADTSALP
jgi:hypothetical protein